jgi:hypothetical protein
VSSIPSPPNSNDMVLQGITLGHRARGFTLTKVFHK